MKSANNLMIQITVTQTKAKEWTANAYRTSNTELYELLSRCYTYSQYYRNADIGFKQQLNILLKEAKHTFNEGTRIETKVVRVVFGEVFEGSIGRSRGAIYSKVLASAHEAKVIPKQFIKWLNEQGGVEAVRKPNNGKTPAQVKTERALSAHEQLASKPQMDIGFATPSQNYAFSLALVSHVNGDKRIVALLNNSTLVKEALAKAFVELETQSVSLTSTEPLASVTKINARKKLTKQDQVKEAA